MNWENPENGRQFAAAFILCTFGVIAGIALLVGVIEVLFRYPVLLIPVSVIAIGWAAKVALTE